MNYIIITARIVDETCKCERKVKLRLQEKENQASDLIWAVSAAGRVHVHETEL